MSKNWKKLDRRQFLGPKLGSLSITQPFRRHSWHIRCQIMSSSVPHLMYTSLGACNRESLKTRSWQSIFVLNSIESNLCVITTFLSRMGDDARNLSTFEGALKSPSTLLPLCHAIPEVLSPLVWTCSSFPLPVELSPPMRSCSSSGLLFFSSGMYWQVNLFWEHGISSSCCVANVKSSSCMSSSAIPLSSPNCIAASVVSVG